MLQFGLINEIISLTIVFLLFSFNGLLLLKSYYFSPNARQATWNAHFAKNYLKLNLLIPGWTIDVLLPFKSCFIAALCFKLRPTKKKKDTPKNSNYCLNGCRRWLEMVCCNRLFWNEYINRELDYKHFISYIYWMCNLDDGSLVSWITWWNACDIYVFELNDCWCVFGSGKPLCKLN